MGITVTIRLDRNSLNMSLGSLGEEEDGEERDGEDQELIDEEEDDNIDKEAEEKEDDKKKGPAWKKPQQKKKAKKSGKPGKQKKKAATTKPEAGTEAAAELKEGESGSESEGEDSGSEESGSEKGEKGDKSEKNIASEDDEEEQEWARFQKGVNKREKALSGKSRVSHSVHSPYFTDDKQEFWWVYISDRKSHSLITPPYHLTNLVDCEEVELKFTAPGKPGHYNFTVCVRSDSYFGCDLLEDIKLDVQEAREAPTEHPQWEFEDEDEDEEGKDASAESEFATDDDYEEDSD